MTGVDDRPAYFDAYPTIAFDRGDLGVLTVRLHSNGGPVRYSPQHHHDWVRAFVDIADDRDNRVMILTGTGDSFIDVFAWDERTANAQMWDVIYYEGKHLLRRLLDIEIPIIGVVNGAATIHAELALMSDITLASEGAIVQDKAHVLAGAVPGDGVQVVWQELLGPNRGRYFLLTGQVLSAAEALDLGVVNEVLPTDELMPRARKLARELAARPVLQLRYTRVVLTGRLKRLIDESLSNGLAVQGLAILDSLRLAQEAAEADQDD